MLLEYQQEKKEIIELKMFEEIMEEKFPKLTANTKPQNKKPTQITPNRLSTKKSKLRCFIFKLQKTKDKEKILEANRETKHLIYRGTRIIIIFTSY